MRINMQKPDGFMLSATQAAQRSECHRLVTTNKAANRARLRDGFGARCDGVERTVNIVRRSADIAAVRHR